MLKSNISYGDFNPTLLYISKYNRVRGKSRTHDHDNMEICFVISGKCKFEINDNYYIGASGDVLLCNPGTTHSETDISGEEGTILFFIGLTDFHFHDTERNHFSIPYDYPLIHTEGEERQALHKLCYEMLNEQEQNHLGKYYMLRSYLVQFIMIILRLKEEPEILQNTQNCTYYSHRKSHIVKRTIDYLNNHYTEKISLDQLSQNVYLSPVYISKVFKEETGESPINYLIRIRLEKAKNALEHSPEKSISEIAISVGYQDTYHFSKLFKKYYGEPPSYYTKKSR